MKTNYSLILLLVGFLSHNAITAQVFFEDFEDETEDATSFTSNGQEFNILDGPTDNGFAINFIPGIGWNETTASFDERFIDNSGIGSTSNDGASLTIASSDLTPFTIKSLFTFVATSLITEPDPYTITFQGFRSGQMIYSFTRTDGFSDVNIFEPSNGYTRIDFATDGEQDYSRMDINSITISTTGDSDYISLDSFSWGPENALSVDGASLNENSISVFPNPASSAITVSGITNQETYRIYNVLGAETATGVISNNESISIQDLSNGLYLINFDNGNNIKFLKE